MNTSGTNGIFINQYLKEILLLLYADDLSIISDTVGDLQRKIAILEKFCSDFDLEVNMSKTKVVVFRNGGILRKYENFYFKGRKIDCVSYYNYLGILFSSWLFWSKAVSTLSVKAKKSLIPIQALLRKTKSNSVSINFKIFDSIVKPILLYGAEIWGYEYKKERICAFAILQIHTANSQK